MSPGYTPPSVETIHEPEHGEHRMDLQGQEMGRGRNSPESAAAGLVAAAKAVHATGTLRSGSPKLHYILQAQPRSRSVERRRGSALPVPSSSRSRSAHSQRRHTVGGHTRKDSRLRHTHEHDAEGECLGSVPGTMHSEQKRSSLSPSTLSSLTDPTIVDTASPESGSSSRSGSTIRETTTLSQPDHEGAASADQENAGRGPATRHPDALSYMDLDSPEMAEDTIEQNAEEVNNTWNKPKSAGSKSSPSARSSSSSSSFWSGPHSDASSERTADTERSASPDDDGEEAPTLVVTEVSDGNSVPRGHPTYRYGTPEMPRGTARLPHHSGNVLAPRVPGQVKHLPRAEKLPMSGYQLLASRISSSGASSQPPSRRQSFISSNSSTTAYQAHSRRDSLGGISIQSAYTADDQSIKPIYRRFEALNHRLLLHLQDELSELEEQLHRLDTTETQKRRAQSRILPASRRAEYLAGGELQWHKTDILGKIGFKLQQYNHVLASFTSTRDIPAPSISDINEYRTYLATHEPITEVETRFLDPVDDLITLAVSSSSSSASGSSRSDDEGMAREYFQSLNDNLLTPMPGRASGSWEGGHSRNQSLGGSVMSSPKSPGLSYSPKFPVPRIIRSSPSPSHKSTTLTEGIDTIAKPSGTTPPPLFHMAIAIAVAVLVPILAFSVIPSFIGRMTVVLLVGLSVICSELQSGAVNSTVLSRDLMGSVAIYAAVMAVVAGVI